VPTPPMGKIIHRYIFQEVLTPFLLGLSVFTFILLIARLLKLIELVVNRGLPPTQILRLLAFLMPAFLELTVPMAMLLAILIAFGRLSADAEMIAMRSSGLSIYQLVPPVILFVLMTSLITACLSMYARPWANHNLKLELWDIARTRASAGLKPQVFNDEFPGLVIYAEHIDSRTDRLIHVLISDERDPNEHNTVFAREGYMISDNDTQTVILRLLDGTIHTSGEAQSDYHTDFETYDVNLDLRESLAGPSDKQDDPNEMTLPELSAAIEVKRAAGKPAAPELVEFHRKFAIPFACIVFGLVGVPLGIEPARNVRSRGFAVSLAVIFIYYILLSAGQGFAEQGSIPAWFGLWLPNMVFGSLGVMLMRRAARERALFGTWIPDLAAHLRNAFMIRRRVGAS
jgi:lipopolysaccharide export system permease protein